VVKEEEPTAEAQAADERAVLPPSAAQPAKRDEGGDTWPQAEMVAKGHLARAVTMERKAQELPHDERRVEMHTGALECYSVALRFLRSVQSQYGSISFELLEVRGAIEIRMAELAWLMEVESKAAGSQAAAAEGPQGPEPEPEPETAVLPPPSLTVLPNPVEQVELAVGVGEIPPPSLVACQCYLTGVRCEDLNGDGVIGVGPTPAEEFAAGAGEIPPNPCNFVSHQVTRVNVI